MQSISWLAFGSSNALSRTIVHFFPSSGTVSAPYPARCKFRLFGEGETGKSVTIEGPRLSHPDGVRLDQVFPTLSDGVPGFLGLEVSLSAVQPRVDLSPSLCMIELSSRASSTRFRPVRLESAGTDSLLGHKKTAMPDKGAGLVMSDSFAKTSVVLVNASGEARDVSIKLWAGKQLDQSGEGVSRQGEVSKEPRSLSPSPIPAYSVKEIQLSKEGSGVEGVVSKQCSWGVSDMLRVEVEDEMPIGTACYLVHRDAVTNMPVSVSAL